MMVPSLWFLSIEQERHREGEMTDQRVPATMTTTSSSIIRANGLKERNISLLYIQRDKMRKKRPSFPKLYTSLTFVCRRGPTLGDVTHGWLGRQFPSSHTPPPYFLFSFLYIFFFFDRWAKKAHRKSTSYGTLYNRLVRMDRQTTNQSKCCVHTIPSTKNKIWLVYASCQGPHKVESKSSGRFFFFFVFLLYNV